MVAGYSFYFYLYSYFYSRIYSYSYMDHDAMDAMDGLACIALHCTACGRTVDIVISDQRSAISD